MCLWCEQGVEEEEKEEKEEEEDVDMDMLSLGKLSFVGV